MQKETLDALLAAIDADLTAREVPIHARPLRALCEFGRQTKVDTRLPRSRDEFGETDFSDEALGSQILRWYEGRYGKRLAIHMGPGSVAVLIHGTPWEMKLPLIYGRVHFTCHRNLAESRKAPALGSGSREVRLNILQCLNEFPDEAARHVSDADLQRIGNRFIHDLDLLQSLPRNHEYIPEALSDLKASVSAIVNHPPHYGFSKWSSLQFLEKIMKSRLGKASVARHRHHRLEEMAEELRARCSVDLSPDVVAKVQCSASVRYGEVVVSLDDAVAAHEASLLLAGELYPGHSFSLERLSPTPPAA